MKRLSSYILFVLANADDSHMQNLSILRPQCLPGGSFFFFFLFRNFKYVNWDVT